MNKKYDVLGAGIAAVDDLISVAEYPPVDCKVAIHGSTRQGGGPACTAIAAAGALGGRTAYVARFGSDELSKYIEAGLASRKVDTSHIVRDQLAGPYHSVIVVDRMGHRNVFYDPTLYKALAADDLPADLIQSAGIFLLDHLTEPALTTLAIKVRSLGVPVLADIEGQSESSMTLAAFADYLIVPKGFACWSSNCSAPSNACASLAEMRRAATVVTNGAEGCYFSTKEHPAVRHFAAFAIQPFDTNGCGDTFHGAFALAIARALGVEEAITFASAAAALKGLAGGGKRRGWNALPTLNDVLQFLRERLNEREKILVLERIDSVMKGFEEREVFRD
jgi:sugar/nucleoside kinase (ribokinase family)